VNPQKQTILLTGAAGRVGKLLAPHLRQQFALRLCDIAPVAGEDGDEILQGDLADMDFARRAAADTAGVVHLAGLVASGVSFEDTLDANYRAVLALLESCRQEKVQRFVFASSHHTIGLHPSEGVLDEFAPLAPDSFYGLSKAFGEAACALYAHRFGIRTLVIRIGNADPEVVDARRERLWISGRDLAALVSIGLTAESLRYEIVYGVSNCPNALFRDDAAARLGYQPRDFASEHRAATFRDAQALGPSDGAGTVGGFFAVDPLPPALDRRRVTGEEPER